jgi:serine protease Do
MIRSFFLCLVLLLAVEGAPCVAQTRSSVLNRTVAQTLPKTVKIIGSGGFRGLEAYQSGFLISGDGHVLTAWSYVLDSDVVTLTMDDGLKREAQLIGFDPRLDIAVLKIDVSDTPHFNLEAVSTVDVGDRILAFSNLYGVATGDEPVSVQQGFVSAKIRLSARRGAYQSPYQDEAYLLDAMTNNPGAAGGALTDRQGRLVAMVGKELRDSKTGAWLNFALPMEKLTDAIERIRSGEISNRSDSVDRPTEPVSATLLGFSLVADIVQKTPPYIDRVVLGSAAAKGGARPDDLIIEVNGQMTASVKDVLKQFQRTDRDDAVELTVQRGNRFIDMKLRLGQ